MEFAIPVVVALVLVVVAWKMLKGLAKTVALVYEDEDRFLDRDGLVWMVADEPTVVIDRQR